LVTICGFFSYISIFQCTKCDDDDDDDISLFFNVQSVMMMMTMMMMMMMMMFFHRRTHALTHTVQRGAGAGGQTEGAGCEEPGAVLSISV
jgi:hypothetical protein